MALILNDQTYSGTYSETFITKAMYGMDTVNKGLVFVKGGIKKQHTITRLDTDKVLRRRQAVPVPSANPNYTMDGKLIIPKDVEIYTEYNPRDLEAIERSEQLSDRLLDRKLPAGMQTQLVQLTLNRAGEKYEDMLWQGSTAYNTEAINEDDDRFQLQFFDGFLKRFVSDPLINLSSISPVVITVSNVLDILDDLIEQATIEKKALITNDNTFETMKFILSAKTCTIYTEALGTGTDFKGINLDSPKIPRYRGYKVERVAGMADNTIVYCKATDEYGTTNLFVGMNSMKDWSVKVDRTAPANETFFIQAKMKWDVQYGWSDEIFLYTTLTAANFLP